MDSHLVLIDLSSIWRAAWHASADESLSSAFEKTLQRVHTHIHDSGATHAAVCLDAPPYTHRTAILPTYKAQREKPPAAMHEQFDRLKARLVADGLLLWSSPGFEADDVIATATTAATARRMTVTVVSADKDLLQLVDDATGVRVYSPASETYYDQTKVIEKFGVAPVDILEFLALVGDASDNVPGIDRVGPKTAAKLLIQYGSLHEVLAHADLQTPKLCESLINGAENARLAKRVIALRHDVPIRFESLFEERKAIPLKQVAQPTAADGFDDADDHDEFAALISPPKSEPKASPAPASDPKSEPRAATAPEPKSEPKAAPAGPGVKSTAAAPEAPQTSLVVHNAVDWSMQLEPRNLKQAWWLAEQMANSRLFSKFGSVEASYMVMLRGRALGLDAVSAAGAFHNIDGKLAMHADLIEALVLRSGKAEFFELVESTNARAVYETKRVGGRRVITMEFSIEDACRAQLVDRHPQGLDGFRGYSNSGKPSNWDKYRSTMLRHRAKTQLARAVYADVVLGLYTPDEASDGRTIDAEFEAA